jgi:hypothetical protein
MEASMPKLLTGFAAAALALSASFAQAECAFHNQQVTASADQTEQSVAMSTYDPMAPVVVEEATPQVALPECPADAKDGVPTSK